MADRLSQLLRQRALLQEHLAWLDREIAEASGDATAPAASVAPKIVPVIPAPAAIAPAVAPRPVASSYLANQAAQILAQSKAQVSEPAVAPAIEAVADQIIEQYRTGPDTTKSDVKKGCLLYFFGAFVFLALGVVGLYYIFERGR